MFKKIFFHWNELGLLQMEILMKKKPIILVLILWSFINVSSEEIFKDVLPGQYIFYQDKRVL